MSTLQVENLIGPTSGSNANKVIIPSGQTLYAAGHVVQVVRNTFTAAHVTTTSTSFSSMGSSFNLAITPKFSNSIILIDIMLNPYISGSSHSGAFNIHNGSGLLGHATNGYGIVPPTGGSGGQYRHFNINASDTASSTSTITYQVYHRSDNTGVTFYGNHANLTNHIRLTEIAQ